MVPCWMASVWERKPAGSESWTTWKIEPKEEMGRAKGTSQASERIVRIVLLLPLVFTVFVFLLVLLRDDCSYFFLLLDDPPGAIAVVSGIESILINLVGQIPRLDGPVCRPLVYPAGGSGLAGLLDFLGGGESITDTRCN